MKELNYKELLKKYMERVVDSEGIDYIWNGFRDPRDIFTDEEIEELEKISNEIEL